MQCFPRGRGAPPPPGASSLLPRPRWLGRAPHPTHPGPRGLGCAPQPLPPPRRAGGRGWEPGPLSSSAQGPPGPRKGPEASALAPPPPSSLPRLSPAGRARAAGDGGHEGSARACARDRAPGPGR